MCLFLIDMRFLPLYNSIISKPRKHCAAMISAICGYYITTALLL